MKNLSIILGVFLTNYILISVSVAQQDLEIAGIIYDEKPVAIINGKVVKEGDKLGEAQVIKIGSDFVNFKIGGETITKQLKEIPINTVPEERKSGNTYQGGSAGNYRLQTRIEENIQKAQSYINEADNFLDEQRVMSLGKYNKVLSLYDKSEREFQYALEGLTDKDSRDKIEASLRILREGKYQLKRKEESLEKQINDAMEHQNAIFGMTKSDVTRSWGQPTEINRSNYSGSSDEQWIYGTPPVRPVYLYFNEGILVSKQDYETVN